MLKLSIIIPVYNVEKYLSKCLDSVIYPDIADYEIIVVNDGSTDSSPEIAENYARRYPQLIKLINKENGGLGSARNAGIAHAQGEFLVFLDSDDCLSPNAVEEMLDSLQLNFDIAIYDYISVNEYDRELSRSIGCEKQGSFSFSDYPEILFAPPSACNKIFKKSLFIENNIVFPTQIWFEDLATIPRLFLHCNKISNLAKPWYKYLQRSGSITNSKNPQRNSEIITVCNMVIEYYKKNNQYEKYRYELEYMLAYNELITSTTRVNLADRKSAVQDELLEFFIDNVPDFKDNPYIHSMPAKLKLLMKLILKKYRLSINLLMRLNNFIKKKDR